MINIIRQLWDIYNKEEYWHRNRLDLRSFELYTTKMLRNGNLLAYVENGAVLGYIEYFIVDFVEMVYLEKGLVFPDEFNGDNKGPYCYIINCWIDKSRRGTKVHRALKDMVVLLNPYFQYWAGKRVKNGKFIIKERK